LLWPNLFPIEEREVPQSDIPGEMSSPTQPFPVLPKPLASHTIKPWGVTFWDEGVCEDLVASFRNEGIYTPPSVKGSVTFPNGTGANNWGNASYHPGTNMLIVTTTQLASVNFLIPREEGMPSNVPGASSWDTGGAMKGTPYKFHTKPIMSPVGAPCTAPPWGLMTAIDMDSGKEVWKVPFGAVPVPWAPMFSTLESWGSPLIGGPISTAGGLIFAGASLDKKFRAVDLKTGEVVWRAALPAPGNATPMTYSYKGKQYVVIAAGGNAMAATTLDAAIVAFALED
jgi:quinoprotein glucose dehydrogenase